MFTLWVLVEKTDHVVEIYWLSIQERKYSEWIISREEHADNFLGYKRPIIVFLEKDAAVNRVSFCQFLRQYFTLFIELLSYFVTKNKSRTKFVNMIFVAQADGAVEYTDCTSAEG